MKKITVFSVLFLVSLSLLFSGGQKEEPKEEKEESEGIPLKLEGGLPGMGGVSITFKNVRIVADKMIIEKKEK